MGGTDLDRFEELVAEAVLPVDPNPNDGVGVLTLVAAAGLAPKENMGAAAGAAKFTFAKGFEAAGAGVGAVGSEFPDLFTTRRARTVRRPMRCI